MKTPITDALQKAFNADDNKPMIEAYCEMADHARALENALWDIATMPEYDQDDAHRLRWKGFHALKPLAKFEEHKAALDAARKGGQVNLTRFSAQNAQFHDEGSFILASDAEKEIERLTRERDDAIADAKKWREQEARKATRETQIIAKDDADKRAGIRRCIDCEAPIGECECN